MSDMLRRITHVTAGAAVLSVALFRPQPAYAQG